MELEKYMKLIVPSTIPKVYGGTYSKKRITAIGTNEIMIQGNLLPHLV